MTQAPKQLRLWPHKKMLISAPVELFEDLNEMCRREKRTRSELIREVLRKCVKEYKISLIGRPSLIDEPVSAIAEPAFSAALVSSAR